MVVHPGSSSRIWASFCPGIAPGWQSCSGPHSGGTWRALNPQARWVYFMENPTIEFLNWMMVADIPPFFRKPPNLSGRLKMFFSRFNRCTTKIDVEWDLLGIDRSVSTIILLWIGTPKTTKIDLENG